MEHSISNLNSAEIVSAVKQIKDAILVSRYNAARMANKELLSLYYCIGEFISIKSRNAKWGTGAIKSISQLLQKELPGLRGFSESGLKRMRTFYEGWSKYVTNRPMTLDDFPSLDSEFISNRPITLDDFTSQELEWFLSIGFSHHYEILIKSKSLQERLYYIRRCATEFWSVDKLRYMFTKSPYNSLDNTSNNFLQTIPNPDYRVAVMRAFKDEYLLDYVNIEDPDTFDERILENQIVHNIKNFILTFGKDFTFMGNQYRIIVGDKEYFIDLLFYHRSLRCLVAVELKKNEFLAEYAGKLNLYLSALDECVKNPDENPSIGIVLCRDKDEKTVQYAFRGFTTPMGVAKYRTADELPYEIRNALPNPDDLKKLL
ncbi:MAG: PDDEXK nuclease domain-containing protein [Muribaculaceae bacterium]|nr:PDDEXK nuclease domain-containing protein [Muribaculaceae bacterium]